MEMCSAIIYQDFLILSYFQSDYKKTGEKDQIRHLDFRLRSDTDTSRTYLYTI